MKKNLKKIIKRFLKALNSISFRIKSEKIITL